MAASSDLSLDGKISFDASAAQRAIGELQSGVQSLASALRGLSSAPGLGKVAGDAEKAAPAATRLASAFQNLNRSAVAIAASTAGLVAGLRSVIGASTSLETALARVAKVTDATDAEVAALKGNLVGLSRQVPRSAVELAQIAEAGGQLGIALQDLPRFTQLAAQASTAFDMTAQETGQTFGVLKNVYQLSIDGLADYADSINVLGNNFATSEKQIIDVAARVGGTAAVFGLTKEQVSALAAATLSLGISPERASTALAALMTRLQTVQAGSKEAQQTFAALGLDAQKFGELIKKDADGALQLFFRTIEKFDSKSQAIALTNIFGRENADEIALILRATQDYQRGLDLLADSTKRVNAVQREAERMSSTTAGQMQIARNAASEAADALGSALAPALASIATAVRDVAPVVAEFLRDNKALAVAAVAAATALAAFGAAGVALGGVITTFGALKVAIGGAFALLSPLAAAMGPVGLAIAGVTAGVVLLVSKWDSVKQFFSGLIDLIRGTRKEAEATAAPTAKALPLISEADTKAAEAEVRRLKGAAAGLAQARKQLQDKGKKTLDLSALTSGGGNREDQSLAQLFEAQLRAVQKRLSAALDEQRAQLDAGYKSLLITQEQYLADKERLDLAALANERSTLGKQRDMLQQQLRKVGLSPETRNQLTAQLLKVDADIDALTSKERTVVINARLAADEARKATQQLIAELQADVAQMQGQSLAATLQRIAAESARLLDDPRVRGNAQAEALVRQREEVQGQEAVFSDLRDKLARQTQGLQLEEQRLQQQRERGAITGYEYDQQRIAAIDAQTGEIEKTIAAMERMAAAAGNPALVQAAQQARNEWERTKSTVNEFASSLNRGIADAVANGVSNFSTLGDFVRGVLTDILRSWQSMLTKMLSDQLFKMLQQGLSGLGNPGSAIASGLGWLMGKADGGYIAGPGTGTSDSILARLSNGEYVLRAAAVRKLGVGLLDYLNRFGRLPARALPAFNTGGLVAAGAGAGGSSTTVNLAPALYLDRTELTDAVLGSSEFEARVLKVVMRNGKRVQSAF